MAVKWARWLDHLPLWVAWGASAATGVYEPIELALMALPLMVAAAVEGARRDAGRYHRWLEVGALLFFLGDLARGQGLYTVAIHTLFVLAGVRLVLPRESPQRRQLLLMSFLLFLTTAIGTTDLAFLGWTLAWFGTAMLAMLHQSWEPSAALRRGALARPPYGQVPLWLGGALLLGTAFFLVMPRVGLGLRSGLLLGPRALGQAGLGDSLDLSGGGPIAPNPEVALRVVPLGGVDPLQQRAWTQGLERLRGLTLEAVKDLRWEADDLTPPIIPALRDAPGLHRAEFNFTPSLHGILALPTGLATLEPSGLPIVRGTGASLRWRYVRARTRPFEVTWDPGLVAPREARLSSRRLDLLTHLEPDQACAQRASLRFAPGFLPTPQLASTLEAALRRFQYTLDNPSGQAANPLEDFLERSQAGHCEYFASAMALMLRARGVPARVVTGYRLGPWIPEGGYFRISQNEAHSWVEYLVRGPLVDLGSHPRRRSRQWRRDPSPGQPGTLARRPPVPLGPLCGAVLRRGPAGGARLGPTPPAGLGVPLASPPRFHAALAGTPDRPLAAVAVSEPLAAPPAWPLANPRPESPAGPHPERRAPPAGRHGPILAPAAGPTPPGTDGAAAAAGGCRRCPNLRPGPRRHLDLGQGGGGGVAGLEGAYFALNFSKAFMSSMGSGKMMVLFFSVAISARVCR